MYSINRQLKNYFYKYKFAKTKISQINVKEKRDIIRLFSS